MFTGLVAEVGEVVRARPAGSGRELWVRCGFTGLALGESIACDGVCLTVEGWEGGSREGEPAIFRVTAGEETLRCTTWGHRQIGHRVHLERALRLSDRLGGHLVSGHVDGVGALRRRAPRPGWLGLSVEAPAGLARYIAAKGSVCIEGVSLTVNAVEGSLFEVGIIPHTGQQTRLAGIPIGEPLNLEIDLLARYVERLMQAGGPGGAAGSGGAAGPGGITDALRRNGFL